MSQVCPRCEKLPDALPDAGTLYLYPPIKELHQSMKQYFNAQQVPFDTPVHGMFAIRFSDGDLRLHCREYFGGLNQLMLEDTKSLILPEGSDEPRLEDFIRMQPLASLVKRIQGSWLMDILREERVRMFFQPIVRAADPGDIFAYECLARGLSASGEIISPVRMFEVARSTELLFYLDRVCRLAAIRDAQVNRLTSRLFINFNPTAIYQPDFCLKSTLAAIKKAGLPPENIVFEVVESEEINDTDHLLNLLRFYRESGFKVALDDLGAGFSTLNLLSKLRPDFIKLDLELIRDVDKDPYKASITANLLAMAKTLPVATIAEGVETPGEYHWLKEHGADYLQGFLFAKPSEKPVMEIGKCC